jgi:hypothetical protein
MPDSLVIPSRFSGPPGSGNGGYVCGRIAAFVDGPATNPPLAMPDPVSPPGDHLALIVARTLRAGSARVGPGGEVLAAARAVWLDVARPAPAPAAEEVS